MIYGIIIRVIMMMIYGKDILVSFIVWQQMHALVISRMAYFSA